MMDALKYFMLPVFIFTIILVGLITLIFDFIYELYVNLLKSEND